MAAGNNALIFSMVTSGTANAGNTALIVPNLSPIVSALSPKKKHTAVDITIATTCDGIFVDIFLIINMITTVPIPIAADDILIVERFENILIHLSINSGVVSLYVSPKKSFI